jgi:hypothetical protein
MSFHQKDFSSKEGDHTYLIAIQNGDVHAMHNSAKTLSKSFFGKKT